MKYGKYGPTIFLRLALLSAGAAVLALCVIVLPTIHREWALEFPEIAYVRYPVIGGLGATAIAFFVALHQALKLLNYIDRNKAFSEVSVRILRNIKYCAFVIGGLYAAGMPLVYYIGDADDAPGLILFGLIFTFVPIVIAVFAGVIQRLLQSAIDIKSENDLTV